MPIEAFFDSPDYHVKSYSYDNFGSSPNLISKIVEKLDVYKQELSHVYVCLYLFNNEILDNKLKELSEIGINVQIVTIPIDGYDALYPKQINDYETQKALGIETKYSLAKKIFKNYYLGSNKARLMFFPHTYIRSKFIKKFSKGDLPYSLHIKSILALTRNDEGFLCLSSSNFAVRDLIKEECLVIYENEKDVLNASLRFYLQLCKNAINIKDYDFKKINIKNKIDGVSSVDTPMIKFTAPFYQESNQLAESNILQLIKTAKVHIKIVAQHVCPVSYYVDQEFSSSTDKSYMTEGQILSTIIEKANSGVDVSIISQTFCTGNPEIDKDYRKPSNTKSFIEFYNQIKKIPFIKYFINDRIHSKYIIVDDTVFVSTFNYTPTQFLYLDSVKIKTADLDYEGVFSECGMYSIINDNTVVESFKNNYSDLTMRKNSIRVI